MFVIANFDLDLNGTDETRLLQKALRGRHAVVYGGTPGGLPHPNCERIPNPKEYHVREALMDAGYPEERARILAQKSCGNLGSILRVSSQRFFEAGMG